MTAPSTTLSPDLAERSVEDRCSIYRLLIRLVAAPPSETELSLVAALSGDGTLLGEAIAELAREAAATDAEAEATRFHALFVGLGGGLLTPYASHYLTGALHDRPLIQIRQTMAEMGVRRSRAASEPEDHVATVLEIMLGLLEGRFGKGDADGAHFHRSHIATWVPRFLADLEEQDVSPLYRSVGALGAVFLAEESLRYGSAPVPAGPTRLSFSRR